MKSLAKVIFARGGKRLKGLMFFIIPFPFPPYPFPYFCKKSYHAPISLVERIETLQDESYKHHWQTYTHANESLDKC